VPLQKLSKDRLPNEKTLEFHRFTNALRPPCHPRMMIRGMPQHNSFAQWASRTWDNLVIGLFGMLYLTQECITFFTFIWWQIGSKSHSKIFKIYNAVWKRVHIKVWHMLQDWEKTIQKVKKKKTRKPKNRSKSKKWCYPKQISYPEKKHKKIHVFEDAGIHLHRIGKSMHMSCPPRISALGMATKNRHGRSTCCLGPSEVVSCNQSLSKHGAGTQGGRLKGPNILQR